MEDLSRPLRNGYAPLIGGSSLDDSEAAPLTVRNHLSPSDDESPFGAFGGFDLSGFELSTNDEASNFTAAESLLSPVANKHNNDDSNFAVGERVSYFSGSHNQWLSARIVRPNFDADGVIKSYDLDVRKRAEANKIRRALPDFHGDEESVKRRIEAFSPPLSRRVESVLEAVGIRVKRATSKGGLLLVKKNIRFVAFALEPLVEAITGLILVLNHCYISAGACFCCILTPYLVLCNSYRWPCSRRFRTQLQADAFHKALGRYPGPFGILLTDILVVCGELSDSATVGMQSYTTLRHTLSLLASGPWALIQAVIALLQVVLDTQVISPYWLMVSIPLSIFNAHTAYSSMVLLGSLAQEGDLAAHMESLIRISLGAAPPLVLERIMEEREVIIEEDLTRLNRRGFRSLARTIGRSKVAETVTFRDTGIDRFVNDLAEETERANLWAHFCCDFCDNHFALESVCFDPAVPIPLRVWQEVRRFNMPVLREVWNGRDRVFNRDQAEGPMQEAVREGSLYKLQEALAEFGDDLGKVRTASMLACCLDRWQCLQALLAHTPANVREPMMLSHAAENGADTCLSLLLYAQANPDAKGRGGLTALEMAALKGHSRIVPILLAAQASPDYCGSFTPLASVAFSNAGDIAAALLKAKASVHHHHRNDMLPLHLAAREGATNVVTALLRGMAEVDAQEAKDDMRPLHFAAQRGHVQVVRLLLRQKAMVDGVTRKLNTPLHTASWEGMTEVVQVLIQAHANTELRNGSGCTALNFAEQKRRGEIVELLSRVDPATA